jgi:hypothetical protein
MTQAEYQARLREVRKRAGMCTICGEQDERTQDGRAQCVRCADKVRARQAARVERLKAEGRCIRCGKVNDRPRRTACRACAARVEENRKKAEDKRKESEWDV